MRFEDSKAVNMRIVVLWVVSPSSLAGGYQGYPEISVTTYKTTRRQKLEYHTTHSYTSAITFQFF